MNWSAIKSFITHKLTTHLLIGVVGYALALILQYNFDWRLGFGYNHQTPEMIRQWQFQTGLNFQPVHNTPPIDLFGVDKKEDDPQGSK